MAQGSPTSTSTNERTAILDHNQQNGDLSERKSCFPEVQQRYVLTALSFLGFLIAYAMRVNLSVTIVAMVNGRGGKDSNSTSLNPTDVNGSSLNASSIKNGEFDWDEKTQGMILGAFYYGYVLTQLPGGWLAAHIGGKRVFGWGILLAGVLSFLTPWAARTNLNLFIFVRAAQGFGEGVTVPAIHTIMAEWAPKWERTGLVTLIYSGMQVGVVFALPVSGLLCDSHIAGGWPAVFYLLGILSSLWFLAWMFLVFDTPASHPRISRTEREYIQASLGDRKKIQIPWKRILTSPTVWGLACTHFCLNWVMYTCLLSMPTYLKNILHLDIASNGFVSALPSLVFSTTQTGAGFLADFIRSRHYLTTKNTRKLFNNLGLLTSAVILAVLGCVQSDDVATAVALLTIGCGITGLSGAGFQVNHLDITPRFAGATIALTNFVAAIPGFVSPAVVGNLTNNNQTRTQWRYVFCITAAVNVLGGLASLILGEGEELAWAKEPT